MASPPWDWDLLGTDSHLLFKPREWSILVRFTVGMNGSLFKLLSKPFFSGYIHIPEHGLCLPLYITHHVTFSLLTQPQWDEHKESSCHGLLSPLFYFTCRCSKSTFAFRHDCGLWPYWLDEWFTLETLLHVPPNSMPLYYSLGRRSFYSRKARGTIANFWNWHFTCIGGLYY